MATTLRPATVADEPFLREMLLEAAYRGGRPRPPIDEALRDPTLARYIDGWGREGDAGLVALAGDAPDGPPAGAAWYRRFTDDEPGYGFVDPTVPEVAVGLRAGARGRGTGHRLIAALIELAAAQGHAALSLSVAVANREGLQVYRDCGFVEVARGGASLTMVAQTDPARRPPAVVARPRPPGELDDSQPGVRRWGETVVSRGVVHRLAELPGFVAEVDGEPAGLVLYRIEGSSCEVLSLEALVPGRGVGTALLRAVRHAAAGAGCVRAWLVTTNDNVHAVGFYQRRGWDLVALHRDAIELSRRLKPSIPLTGEHGIPIRSELELERRLDRGP